jgi:hypothetical protein
VLSSGRIPSIEAIYKTLPSVPVAFPHQSDATITYRDTAKCCSRRDGRVSSMQLLKGCKAKRRKIASGEVNTREGSVSRHEQHGSSALGDQDVMMKTGTAYIAPVERRPFVAPVELPTAYNTHQDGVLICNLFLCINTGSVPQLWLQLLHTNPQRLSRMFMNIFQSLDHYANMKIYISDDTSPVVRIRLYAMAWKAYRSMQGTQGTTYGTYM